MADVPPPVIEWAEFVSSTVIPAQAKIAPVSVAPDGRSVSILFEGLEARCDGGRQKTATASLVGSIEPKLPEKTVLKAMRADFRGAAMLTKGGRATVQLGLGQAFDGLTMVAEPQQETADSGDFLRSIYSAADSVPVAPGSDTFSYAPITISVQLTIACPGESSSALAVLDSIDLELWVR